MTTFRIANIYFAAVVLLVPAAGLAQSATPTIDTVISSGKRVTIETREGKSIKGTVFTVSPTTMELVAGGRKRSIAAGDISTIRIRYRDPLADGAKHGAIAGAIAGAVFGAVVGVTTCGDHDAFLNFCSGGGFLVIMGGSSLYGLGIGAATGLLGDSLLSSSRMVYRAPSTSAKFVVSPLGVRSGAGARVTFAW